jgi:hypothetical protein
MTIAKQDFDLFMDRARDKLPGASDASIKAELYDVFQEFFRDTTSWLEDITVHVFTDTTTYDIVPTEGQIIRLIQVFDSNRVPQPATMPTFGQLILQWSTNVEQDYTVTVAKNVVLPKLSKDIPVGPDWVLPVWGNIILDGVLGKMMGSLAKPYSNQTLAAYHLRRFRDGMAQVRTAVLRRNTYGVQAWGYPQNWRTSGQRGGVSTGNATGFFNG